MCEVNRVQHLRAFQRNTLRDIEDYGIGHVLTEHIPDNMSHGNHTKAVIGQISDCEYYFGFQHSITPEQMNKLTVKCSFSETHNDGGRISTNGDGVKQLFVNADTILIYNIDESEKTITEKNIDMYNFFKNIDDEGEQFSNILSNSMTTKVYDKTSPKGIRFSSLRIYQEDPKYKEFFNKIKPYFNNKIPPFGYIVGFDRWETVLDQRKMVDKFKQFLESGCREIQMKNCASDYELYCVTYDKDKTEGEKITVSEIGKIDPTRYADRCQCLTSYFKICDHVTSGNKLHKRVHYWIKDDEKERKYIRNITDGIAIGKTVTKLTDDDKNDIDGTLYIYYVNPNKYKDSEDGENRGGWIFLEETNGKNILVNLIALNTLHQESKFLAQKYFRPGNDYIRGLRIVAKLKSSKYFKTDGRKFKSSFSKDLEKLITHIFEKIYKKGDIYSTESTDRPFKEFHEKNSHNNFKDVQNVTELLDRSTINLLRKKENKKKKKESKKKSPKVNKRIGPQNLNTSKNDVTFNEGDNGVKKIVTHEIQTLNKEQEKRHGEAGGWLYVFHHPKWDSEKQGLIGKIGICLDIPGKKRTWRDRMKEHQKHYPCHKLILEKLYYIKHDLKTFERRMLSIYQNYDVQYKTFSTKRSEFIFITGYRGSPDDNIELYEYLLNNELPKSAEKLDVNEWNNMEISDDEVTPSVHQEE